MFPYNIYYRFESQGGDSGSSPHFGYQRPPPILHDNEFRGESGKHMHLSLCALVLALSNSGLVCFEDCESCLAQAPHPGHRFPAHGARSTCLGGCPQASSSSKHALKTSSMQEIINGGNSRETDLVFPYYVLYNLA